MIKIWIKKQGDQFTIGKEYFPRECDYEFEEDLVISTFFDVEDYGRAFLSKSEGNLIVSDTTDMAKLEVAISKLRKESPDMFLSKGKMIYRLLCENSDLDEEEVQSLLWKLDERVLTAICHKNGISVLN